MMELIVYGRFVRSSGSTRSLCAPTSKRGARHSTRWPMPSQLTGMTARDVALEVEGLGAAYTGYAESFLKQGFGSVVIAAYDKGGQLDKLFQDLSISNRLHRKVLRTHFHGLRIGSKQRAALEATTVQLSAPERMDDAPTAPPPSYSDAMHLGPSVADSPASDALGGSSDGFAG